MGTVFAHRLFDVVAATGLVVYVLYTSRIPDWAKPALSVVIGVGLGLLIAAFMVARRHPQPTQEAPEGAGAVRRLIAMARAGLTVLRRPAPAGGAQITFNSDNSSVVRNRSGGVTKVGAI